MRIQSQSTSWKDIALHLLTQVHRFFSHTVAEAHKKLDSVTLTSQIVNHLMVDTTEVSKTVTLPVYLQL